MTWGYCTVCGWPQTGSHAGVHKQPAAWALHGPNGSRPQACLIVEGHQPQVSRCWQSLQGPQKSRLDQVHELRTSCAIHQRQHQGRNLAGSLFSSALRSQTISVAQQAEV